MKTPWRVERERRAAMQRMFDFAAANAAEDGAWPFDGRGGQIVHKRPFWLAVLRRVFRRPP